MDFILEFLFAVLTSPIRPLRYILSVKYRQEVHRDNDGNRKEILLYVFEKPIMLLGGTLMILFFIVLFIRLF